MLNDQRALAITTTNNLEAILLDDDDDQLLSPAIRDIHPVMIPPSPASQSSSENFTSMSTEFNALVLAGSTLPPSEPISSSNYNQLDRIREDDYDDDHRNINPLAIVPPDNYNPLGPESERQLALTTTINRSNNNNNNYSGSEVSSSVQSVKKEEVESKINAWQDAKIAKINNRFKREDAVINGWEGEQVHKASSEMKKIERKLEEKRAKAHEKMQNDIAKAHRKAEERRASSAAKRGTKVARVLEVANLMRAVGRAPVKRAFF